MPRPKSLVLRAPGTNCDQETVYAFELAGAQAEAVHINRVIENPESLEEADILCIAGGFSYGDDLGAGRVFANQIRLRLRETMQAFRDRGRLIIGICNGFQVLVEAGLLLSDDSGNAYGALGFNQSAKFEARWVNLEVGAEQCVFLQGLSKMYLPVAHAEGKVVLQHEDDLERLRANGQIALTYAGESERSGPALSYPQNPNGSVGAIAAVCDPSGRVLGMMPHPERFVDYTQHPRWTREQLPKEGDGLAVFRNAVAFCR